AETESERALIEHSFDQFVAGRRGTFLARLRRCITDHASEIVVRDMDETGGGARPAAFFPRGDRGALRAALLALAQACGVGPGLEVGPFCPPVSFCRLEISSASEGEVSAARATLGVEETSDRAAIRNAYERTLERTYASELQEDQRARVASLEQSFGLLS